MKISDSRLHYRTSGSGHRGCTLDTACMVSNGHPACLTLTPTLTTYLALTLTAESVQDQLRNSRSVWGFESGPLMA